MASVTEAEMRIIGEQLLNTRQALMEHAHAAAINAGFADRHGRFIAVQATLLGAAQMYALTQHGSLGLYEVFKAMAALMATSDAKKVVTRSGGFELGPEAAAGFTPPNPGKFIMEQ